MSCPLCGDPDGALAYLLAHLPAELFPDLAKAVRDINGGGHVELKLDVPPRGGPMKVQLQPPIKLYPGNGS